MTEQPVADRRWLPATSRYYDRTGQSHLPAAITNMAGSEVLRAMRAVNDDADKILHENSSMKFSDFSDGGNPAAADYLVGYADGAAAGSDRRWLRSTLANPASDDGAALGSSALKWSDLFMASGAVLNFNSGNVTVTHSAGLLAFDATIKLTGECRVAGDVGGLASHNTLTGTSNLTVNSSGVGSIKFKGTTSRDTAGFIKIYVGTTAYYVPVFSAITG